MQIHLKDKPQRSHMAFELKDIQGQLARRIEEVSQYDMLVQHRPGKHHSNADGLSHIPDSLCYCPCYSPGCSLKALPCGGCAFCTQVEMQWKTFNDSVDDIVSLLVRRATEDKMNRDQETIELSQADWPGCSYTDLIQMQEKDPDLSIILDWIKNKREPSTQELFGSSVAKQLNTSGLVANSSPGKAQSFIIVMVLPTCLKEEVLHYCHDNKVASHLGL